jgi:hypothetical protein
MRTLFLALATSAAVFATGVTEVTAGDYLYCIQGDDFPGGAGDCSFVSYQQCQATASGRTAYCRANLRFPNVVLTVRTHLRRY